MNKYMKSIVDRINDYKEKEKIRKKIMEAIELLNVAYDKNVMADIDNVIEIDMLNPYICFEIRTNLSNNNGMKKYYEVNFAFDDIHSIDKAIILNTKIWGSLENVEDYMEKVNRYFEGCQSREDCINQFEVFSKILKTEFIECRKRYYEYLRRYGR